MNWFDLSKWYRLCLGLGLCLLPFLSMPVDQALAKDRQDTELELTDEQANDLAMFVLGNTLFTLYHESGHMLVSELQLPIMGQEEDAVDNLATISMLASDTAQMDEYLVMAMLGWFALAAESYDELVFYGEHDLDQQRGYQTLCLMVGADEQFNDLASDLGLPDDRIDSCIYEYELAADSWEAVTADVVRPEGEKGNKISVVYEPAPEDLKEVADLFRESGLLEQVAGEMDDTFELPEKITYKAQSCDEMNAFWDPEAREMIMCYELMALFATVFVEELME